MTTTETALLNGVMFLLDHREMLKSSLDHHGIQRMNATLKGLAEAFSDEIEISGKRFKRVEKELKCEPWVGTFQSHSDFMKLNP